MDFHELLIVETDSVRDAMKRLDDTAKGVLFIIKENRLIGAISDGDIRRWLLRDGKLTDSVSALANFNPKYLEESQRGNAREFMRKRNLSALPIVNNKLEVKDIIYSHDGGILKQKTFDIPVVLMAGGKGTRLYPYTKILPKPLIPIGEIPISEHIVNQFHRYGCGNFYFIVNYKKNMIKAYFNEIERDYHITYVEEETPLGTGGGVRLVRDMIHSTFILTNCDSIINENYSKIIEEHKRKGNLVTMICSLRNYEVPYGVVEIGKNGSIESMQEKPSMSYFTNTGTYIVEPKVCDYIKFGENIGFPDVINRIRNNKKNVGVYPINESDWFDMGQFDTMENMKERLHITD